MAEGNEKKVSIKDLSVPLALVFVLLGSVGSVLHSAFSKESDFKVTMAKVDSKIATIEKKQVSIQKDVAKCDLELREKDRVLIGIENHLEYLVKTVDEIKVEVKEHTRANRSSVPLRGATSE